MCGGEIRFAVAILVLALAVVATAISTKDSDISPLNLHSKRNSRQARANNDESQLVGGTPLPKVIAVKDNHKPIFKDCLKYRPKIKEEQAVNTYVFTIQAEDNDPPEMGGTVTYKFVSSPGEKERFHVDPESGRITTKDIFDHDEPSREKEAYITVRASDNGQPQLDDACTIKIVIEDINDNAPVFDKVSYSESVPQDLLAGREVMRISATDIDDGNNSLVVYNLDTSSPDQAYFYLHPDNGVIFLNKTIDKPPGYKFKLSAIVKDKGTPALLSSITLDIQVIESNKKSPTFTELPDGPIRLKENFADFHNPIAVIRAVSNIPEEKKLQFELVQGQTEQTNKYHTFLLEPEADSAKIRLGNHLDYEKITDYTLTVRIQNNYKLAAETIINVAVLDVNDNIPIFSGIHSGSVLENEPPGTAVMQVQAFDYDGTTANNQITYELGDSNDPFAIDPITGDITTLKTFDREEHNYYNVKIIATDNAESALIPGKHNSGQQVFLIEISDKNDNRPKFTSDLFVAEAIPENANINELVTQVTALDNDTASLVSYSIVAGNRYDCFVMSSFTGEIRVNQPLDYENVSQFLLDVRANDGIFEDYAKVLIKLENLNDNPPKFMDNYTKIIEEERLYEGCIITVVAFDPDLPDRDGPQNIAYSLVKQEQLKYLNIDNTGCLRLTKPLDRDMPLGFARWQILIMAADHNGKPTDSLRSTTEVILELTDINDNAPFLTNIQPVVWYENQSPGQIVLLTAKDYDSDKNGPPFTFKLNDTSSDIYTKFSIVGNALKSLIRFDREEKKEYNIPVSITDSGVPRMTGVSVLKVVIGDVNDSPMESGSSSIFVYNYKGEAPDMEIGRMYVKDLDDWDLDSKKFKLVDPHPYFEVYASSGTILMRQGTPSGSYFLSCNVSEQNLPYIPLHYVLATVNITVKEIPEEAVDKSGSIRFLNATAEEFILIEQDGSSKKDKLHRRLVQIYNVSYDNVDIFTVANKVTVKDKFLDVRFSAHGSPYYSPEKLNYLILPELKKIEEELGLQIYMVGIDECLIEKEQCEDSCRNVLVKSSAPAAVYTNVTSFVGVSARVESECSCEDTQENFYCLNGGTPLQDKCECPEGYLGPHCQQTMIGFHGDGMAMYKPPVTCVNNHISFYVTTPAPGGMVFYVGTSVYNNLTNVEDFISLEIHNGYPKLLINYGSGVTNLNNTVIQVDDNKPHLIEIVTSKGSIEMFVDRCKLTTCMSLGAPTGNKEIFNANGTEICKFCYHMPLTFVERLQSGKSRAELRQEYLMASFAKSAERRKAWKTRALFTLNSSDYNSRDVSLSEVTEILNKNMHDPVGDPSPVLPRPKNPYGSTLKLKLRMTRNMKNERKFVEVEDKPLLISFVAGPLVLGGPHVDYRALASMYDWRHTPSMIPFVGCISNLTINNVVYDLGNPAYHKNADSACHSATSKAISFSIDTNFLIAILVCVAILCILLLAVVVHRRRSDTWAEKELDDIRENIIAYEDEGGGEGDAGYDLHVLRQMYEGRPPESDRYMHTGLVAAAPDLSGFLDDKKSVLDRDADINPLDDVRHYAYEGDGNSSGSLSSLASSGTEEDDQNFTFLTNFGPRFRKLADMYGDDENDRPSGESWC